MAYSSCQVQLADRLVDAVPLQLIVASLERPEIPDWALCLLQRVIQRLVVAVTTITRTTSTAVIECELRKPVHRP